MEWINIPGSLLAGLDEASGDLDRLEWDAGERRLDEPTLRLALRYGRASRVGLIVDVGDLVPYDHWQRVAEAHAEVLNSRPTYRKTLEKLEAVMPGTLKAEDQSNVELDEAMNRSLAVSKKKFDDALSSQVHSRTW